MNPAANPIINSIMRDDGPTTPIRDKHQKVFDNNSYSIIKKELNKSPKMANYI